MRKSVLVCVLLLAVSSMLQAWNVTALLDRDDCLYKCGEQAVFTVNVKREEGDTAPLKMTMTLTHDGGNVFQEQNCEVTDNQEFVLRDTLYQPGFLRLIVIFRYNDAEGQEVKKDVQAGGGFDVEKIVPGAPEPEDFLAFWQEQLRKADETCPLEVTMTEEPYSSDKVKCYKVAINAPGGRVFCYLSIPQKTKEPQPAWVMVPGAGPGHFCGSTSETCVRLIINVHDYDPGPTQESMKERYKELTANGGYMYIGGPDREKNYYHRAIIGAVRAVRWLAQLPEVDPKHIGYKGISQGGGFGLILGGLLDGTFQGIYCHIPALCDHLGYKLGRASGWPQFISNSKFKRHPDCQTFLPYYDAVNFARHIHCPVRFTVGLIDGTCCPSSVYAAFNAIPSTDKQIINQPYVKHGISHEIDVDSLKWIEELVTGKPWK